MFTSVVNGQPSEGKTVRFDSFYWSPIHWGGLGVCTNAFLENSAYVLFVCIYCAHTSAFSVGQV